MVAVKELAGTVHHALDALKSQPVLMVMMLFQFLLLGLVVWTAHDMRTLETKRFELVLKQCGPREETTFRSPRLQSDESKSFELPPLPPRSEKSADFSSCFNETSFTGTYRPELVSPQAVTTELAASTKLHAVPKEPDLQKPSSGLQPSAHKSVLQQQRAGGKCYFLDKQNNRYQ